MSLNPVTWPFAAKLVGVGVGAAALAGGITYAVSGPEGVAVTIPSGQSSSSPPAVAGGAEPGVTTFVCTSSNTALLLQWRESNGYLTGTVESSQLNGTAPQEQVSSNQGGLSGTLNGSAITLQIGLAQPIYGSLDGGTLTLNVPQQDGSIQGGTCSESDLNGWNSAVASLQSKAGTDNTAAQQAQAQQQHDQDVSNAQQSLAKDVNSLAQDAPTSESDHSLADAVNQMNTDYGTEQGDFQKEQGAGCSDGSMSYDASTVSYDASTVNYDLSSLQGDVNSLQGGDIATVKNDLSSVQNDLSTLQNLGVSPGTDSSQAVAAGNKALTDANNAVSWANGQGATINSQAQTLASTASAYVAQHGC